VRRCSRTAHGLFLSQVARVVSLAFITIALSRHFGPQRFGSFAFGLAFVHIFSVIAALGLDRVIVRHLVERPKQRSTIIRKAFRLKLTIAFTSYVLMLLSKPRLSARRCLPRIANAAARSGKTAACSAFLLNFAQAKKPPGLQPAGTSNVSFSGFIPPIAL
jgi:hypothetical protein